VKRLRVNHSSTWKKHEPDIVFEMYESDRYTAADRIEQLEQALVVFAKRSEWYDEDEPDNLRDWDEEAKPLITIKDLRRARAALENKND
jgi:hypothetical protein